VDRDIVSGAGVARLDAEARLIRAHRKEYERLSKKHGHVEAIKRLVEAHKAEYDELVRRAVAARAEAIRVRAASEEEGEDREGPPHLRLIPSP
jgi:hypothetical protein